MSHLTFHRDDELDRSVSEPPGYVLEWRRTHIGGPLFYTARFVQGDNRTSIAGNYDAQVCIDACQSHHDQRTASFDALKPSAQIQPTRG